MSYLISTDQRKSSSQTRKIIPAHSKCLGGRLARNSSTGARWATGAERLPQGRLLLRLQYLLLHNFPAKHRLSKPQLTGVFVLFLFFTLSQPSSFVSGHAQSSCPRQSFGIWGVKMASHASPTPCQLATARGPPSHDLPLFRRFCQALLCLKARGHWRAA